MTKPKTDKSRIKKHPPKPREWILECGTLVVEASAYYDLRRMIKVIALENTELNRRKARSDKQRPYRVAVSRLIDAVKWKSQAAIEKALLELEGFEA